MAKRTDLEDTAESESIGRLDRLGDAVGNLKGGLRIDGDRIQLIAGGVLAVLGLVAIVLGWYGASHTGFGFEQTPYLISGGLLGLALVFLGGFVYFSYWVTRLVRDSRAQSERASQVLDQIAETLNGAALGDGGRSSRGRSTRGGATFVATRNGSQFHRPDCPVVAGRQGTRRVSGTAKGMTPCRICDPLGD